MTWDNACYILLMAGLVGVAVYGFVLASCLVLTEVVKRWVDLAKKSGER